MTRSIVSACAIALGLSVAGCYGPPQAPSPVVGGGTPRTIGGSTSGVSPDTDAASYPSPLPQGNLGTVRTQPVRPYY